MIATRYPRTAAMLEATRIAESLRAGATELEELCSAAHAYEPGTLRRKVRGIVLATVTAAVECESDSEAES